MKSGWGNGLRGIVALALLTGAAPTHAQIPQDGSTGGVGKEEPKIVAVRIVKENGEVLSNAPAGITVQTGKPLDRSEEHTSELQSHSDLVCRLLLEKKK